MKYKSPNASQSMELALRVTWNKIGNPYNAF